MKEHETRLASVVSNNQQAFNEKIKVLDIENMNRNEKSYAVFLESIRDLLVEEVEERLKRCKTLKLQLTLNSIYVKLVEEQPVEISAYFATDYEKVRVTTDIHELLDRKFEELITRSQDFPAEGSGLSLKIIFKATLTTCLYQPFRGGAFTGLPDVIQKRRAILNPAVHGVDCFRWCVRAYFLNQKMIGELRANDYKNIKGNLQITAVAEARIRQKLSRMSFDSIHAVENYVSIDWDGVDGAVSLDDVKMFVENNPEISINVFGLNDKNEVIGPFYASEEKRSHHINLLYIQDEVNPKEGHFCWIKSKSRLINAQFRKKRSKLHICDYCLLVMYTEDKLKEHLASDCIGIVTKIPGPNEFVQFKSISKQLRAPIVVYADFECALAPIQGCENNPEKIKTKRVEQHVPTSFGFYIKCFDSALDQYVTYRGEEAAKIFVKKLIDCLKELYETHVFGINASMIITARESDEFNRASICYLCEKPFRGGDKVRDHCHLTGKKKKSFNFKKHI